jgi:hypothetical protein
MQKEAAKTGHRYKRSTCGKMKKNEKGFCTKYLLKWNL